MSGLKSKDGVSVSKNREHLLRIRKTSGPDLTKDENEEERDW